MEKKTDGEKLNELAFGKFLKLEKISPAGSLEARKLKSGIAFYWRVTIAGKTERVTIGFYDSSAPPLSLKPTKKGFSIKAATRAAEELSLAHHANLAGGGHRGLIEAAAEAKRQDEEAAAEAQRAVTEAKEQAKMYTLKNLLTDYCDHLKTLGRESHKDARSIFKIHIEEAWPKIAATPANQVTGEQIADMMRKVLELGHGRTANKLRSYVRAAYQVALAARSKASIPVKFKEYRVTSNPGADTVPDESQNNPDKNPLTVDEMRAYWQAIKPMPGFVGAVLRLHLLTGGQRIAQLVKLLAADVSATSITLYDGKGRPGKAPRPHTVPLTKQAAAALLKLEPQGTYAISTNDDRPTKKGGARKFKKGDRHLSASTLSQWAADAAKDIPGFATKRIRSGVETMLAGARISEGDRGRLQSHGITGVQARHYDGHDYMDEKRRALEVLFNLLEKKNGNAVKLKAD